MTFGGAVFLFAVICGVLAIIFVATGDRLTPTEKEFVNFVHMSARSAGVKREGLQRFLFERFEILQMQYAAKHDGLVLSDIPLVKEVILHTYRP